MSAAGRPHADVIQDEAPIDLAALPDPRPMVAVTGTATRRLLDDLETASRQFQAAPATVATERRPCFSRASTAGIWRTARLFAASPR
jgi:hypothetical protein